VRAELLQLAASLTRRSEPFVLAVVVRRRPPSSAQVGDLALITSSGVFHGWLGGSCTAPTVVREARRALRDGKPQLISLSPEPETERRPGVSVFPMTCNSGGSVEIYLEPVLPALRLAVFGSSPTARALVKLGKTMGYWVAALGAFGGQEGDLFPDADQTGTGAADLLRDAETSRRPTFAVVATMGEGDEEAIRDALGLTPAYLGVVASAKRFAQIRETLASIGVPASALDAVRSPAGVTIGARTPEEIALSILAEIVERRRQLEDAEDVGQAQEGEAEAVSVGGAAPTTAIDPICGMTVEIATARHVAEHAGATYYFCCGGCRTRFLAEPERYLKGGQSGAA
jgi:xanthine dehydrogenase accessory factor